MKGENNIGFSVRKKGKQPLITSDHVITYGEQITWDVTTEEWVVTEQWQIPDHEQLVDKGVSLAATISSRPHHTAYAFPEIHAGLRQEKHILNGSYRKSFAW